MCTTPGRPLGEIECADGEIGDGRGRAACLGTAAERASGLDACAAAAESEAAVEAGREGRGEGRKTKIRGREER